MENFSPYTILRLLGENPHARGLPVTWQFADVEEGGWAKPFPGTGNLFKFVQGLISIAVQNNVIVVYDNDAEGIVNFKRSRDLHVPANMSILRLPDIPDFCSFETIGPNGTHQANINGQAAAIECYLDISGKPKVRWNNYSSKIDAYPGELIGKADYMRAFLDQRTRVDGYDYRKITSVLDMIVASCVRMREAFLDGGLRNHREKE